MKAARPAKVVMVQGTTSHAGKSFLAAALCRIFAQDGLRVAPFKAQNMSLNSFVTPDGGELGRAQAVQAQAARVAPTVEMNPILLKPEGERRSQVVVMGRPVRSASAREYYEMKRELWPVVTRALDALRTRNDVVVIEGAGSPAEINLKEHEIVNMRVARYADAPVLLVGDIDRGGVFASLLGTVHLLDPEERALVKAFVINKLRGDPSLLDPGLDLLRDRTGTPVAGVVPYFTDLRIPEEDSLGLESPAAAAPGGGRDGRGGIEVAVVRLPHIANFDDFDPLRREPGVRLRYVSRPDEFGDPDLVILPGSKTTVADLQWLRRQGLAAALAAARRRAGTPVIGICGGYQMLGRRILDPHGVESPQGATPGLGLLPVTTVFAPTKETHQVRAHVAAGRGLLAGSDGLDLTGYEIHMGRTSGEEDRERAPPFRIRERSGAPADSPDGALDREGLTLGTYLHGLFHNHALRRRLLAFLAKKKGAALPTSAPPDPDEEYDQLAERVRRHVDMDAVYRMMGLCAPPAS